MGIKLVKNMKCINELIDDQYPLEEITHTRIIARAILLNEKNEVCLLKIDGYDDFGHRNYYETPGGGVNDGEDLKHAVIREVLEETGITAHIISEIGYVSDYYNLIKRHNMNYYFLLKVDSYGNKHLEEYEKSIIKGMNFYSLKEAVKLYENMNKDKLEILVSRRELPVLLEAISILKNK